MFISSNLKRRPRIIKKFFMLGRIIRILFFVLPKAKTWLSIFINASDLKLFELEL